LVEGDNVRCGSACSDRCWSWAITALSRCRRVIPSPELAAEIHRFLEIVLASLDRDGWLCGTRGSIESPGLMNGFAGIGLGLLRLAEPRKVPSVLGLEYGANRD